MRRVAGEYRCGNTRPTSSSLRDDSESSTLSTGTLLSDATDFAFQGSTTACVQGVERTLRGLFNHVLGPMTTGLSTCLIVGLLSASRRCAKPPNIASENISWLSN